MATISVVVTDALGATATANATAVASSSSWPDATNTGYGATVLSPAPSGVINAPGTYSGLHFLDGVDINVSNVTLKNCLISSAASDNWAVSINGSLKNIVLQNVEIAGAGTSGALGNEAIRSLGDTQITINACNIHGFGQALTIMDGQIIIENNYIWNVNGGPGTHDEGIYYSGGVSADFSMLVQGNSIRMDSNDQTGTIFIEADSNVSNVTINNNLLVGAGYTVYAIDGSGGKFSNVKITNNAMGKGQFGYWDLSGSSGITKSGNYDWITKAPV